MIFDGFNSIENGVCNSKNKTNSSTKMLQIKISRKNITVLSHIINSFLKTNHFNDILDDFLIAILYVFSFEQVLFQN